MDFSKLKLELYDVIGLILPGLIAICEGWILLYGWSSFIETIGRIGASGLTLLLLFAFGAGNVVQELGDVLIKAVKGVRFFRAARDRFWVTADAEIVRNSIQKELGHQHSIHDSAFDYCLTKVKDRFAKRDVFLATSDLCRSLLVLSALALLPTVRHSFTIYTNFFHSCVVATILIAMLVTVCSLMWGRMVRFRELSETTVFLTYLASA